MTEPTRDQDARRIAVIGASRGLGRSTVAAAVARGYEVTALARSAPGPSYDGTCAPVADVLGDSVRWIRGTATDADAVRDAVSGAAAVVVTLGASARDGSGLRAAGTRVVLDVMRRERVRRLVVCSSLGVGDSAAMLSPAVRFVLAPLFMRHALDDHADQEGIVTVSNLDWTVLRPGALTGECGGATVIAGFTDTRGVSLRIPRADVASYALDHLDDETTLRRWITLGTAKA